MADPKRTAEDLVRAFARAWEARNPDQILSFMAKDVVYQNVPVPEMRGHEEVRKFITPNLQASREITWEFLHNVADPEGRRVLNERIDTFIFDEGAVPVPVMGIFEIENGLITQWRDYSDIGSFVRDMAAIGRAPGPGIVD